MFETLYDKKIRELKEKKKKFEENLQKKIGRKILKMYQKNPNLDDLTIEDLKNVIKNIITTEQKDIDKKEDHKESIKTTEEFSEKE